MYKSMGPYSWKFTFWTKTDDFLLDNGSHESYKYRKLGQKKSKFFDNVRFAEKSVEKTDNLWEITVYLPELQNVWSW